MNTIRRPCAAATLALAIVAAAIPSPLAAAQPAPLAQKTFASPENAVAALRAAVKVHDKAALREIFGPEVHDLLTGDEAQDKANSQRFARAIDEGVKPVAEGTEKVFLEIGAKRWPFPIPLVKADSAWRFDTAAGKDEIINRHIGRDELHAIGLCRAYVQARNESGASAAPKAIHGYAFRLLPRQVSAVPGGFALAAYPEHWGRSGIMTFIVDQSGKIYRRDLGEKTSQLAPAMTGYDPDGDWTLENEQGVVEK